MKKRNQSLNKIERMLLESRFPTLRVLLEDEEKKEDKPAEEPAKEEPADAGGGDDKGGGDDGGGDLADLFGDSGEAEPASGEVGGDAAAEGGDEAAPAEGGEGDMGGDMGTEEPSTEDKQAKKDEEEKAVKAAVKKAEMTYKDVVSDVLDRSVGDSFNDKLFGVSEGNSRKRYQMKRLQENISKYLFKNVNMRSIKNKKNMSLKNSFEMNESKLLKVNYLMEAKSVDDMINNKFWEDNASVDLIVDNAINLTKNFQNLIDIPALIMNSVAIKFGRQAAEEAGDNQNAQNEYKLKLEEFLDKYSKSLAQLPDYENYDTSKYRFDMTNPDKQAVGAFSPGG